MPERPGASPVTSTSRRSAGSARRSTRSPATSPWSRHERRLPLRTRARSAGALPDVLGRNELLGRARGAPCGRRREPHAAAGEGLCARRRERERQEHRGTPPQSALRADGGIDPARERGRDAHPQPSPHARVPRAGTDDLPGPVRVAEPGQARRPPPGPPAADPPRRPQRPGAPARVRAARDGRARARCCRRREVPARALGGAASARSDRTGPWPSSRRSCSRTSRSRCSTCRSGSGS